MKDILHYYNKELCAIKFRHADTELKDNIGDCLKWISKTKFTLHDIIESPNKEIDYDENKLQEHLENLVKSYIAFRNICNEGIKKFKSLGPAQESFDCEKAIADMAKANEGLIYKLWYKEKELPNETVEQSSNRIFNRLKKKFYY